MRENSISYQSMSLCFRKIIRSKKRIKPDVQEEPRIISLFQNEASGTDILAILSHDEVDVAFFQVRECLDDTIWRYHGEFLQHERFEAAAVQKMGFQGLCWVHDQCVWTEVEEVWRVGMAGHRMTNRWSYGPGSWGNAQGICVIGDVRVEVCVACACRWRVRVRRRFRVTNS